MNDVRVALRRFIEENFVMRAGGLTLADGDSFLDHHVLDSTGFLELVAHLEQAYGIKVGDDEMVPENLDTLDNLVRFIAAKRSA